MEFEVKFTNADGGLVLMGRVSDDSIVRVVVDLFAGLQNARPELAATVVGIEVKPSWLQPEPP